MSDRHSHLAGIEARRLAAGERQEIEILAADLRLAPDDNSYNPYDKPGPAKPLRFDRLAAARVGRKRGRKNRR